MASEDRKRSAEIQPFIVGTENVLTREFLAALLAQAVALRRIYDETPWWKLTENSLEVDDRLIIGNFETALKIRLLPTLEKILREQGERR